jgi:hypothetical protein
MLNYKELQVDQVFGNLTLIERVVKGIPEDKYVWRCLCACSEEKGYRIECCVDAEDLVNNKITDCGCLRYNKLKPKKDNRLTTTKNKGKHKQKVKHYVNEEVDNIARTLPEWCEQYNKPYHVVYQRLRMHWPLYEALTVDIADYGASKLVKKVAKKKKRKKKKQRIPEVDPKSLESGYLEKRGLSHLLNK